MKLVVGLGNPGRQYAGTRHNVGFEVIERLARRHGAGPLRAQFESLVAELRIDGEKVVLAMPQTYMNLSGRAVRRFVDYFQLEPAGVLVVCDDMNLPLARLRLRGKGSAGGQKGLNDILRALGTQEVPRLRIGIGRPPQFMDATAWVLGKFTAREREQIEPALERAADAVELWCRHGLTHAMNEVNAPETPPRAREQCGTNEPAPGGSPQRARMRTDDPSGRSPDASGGDGA